MADHLCGREAAERIAERGKTLDYEQEALNSIKRSWEVDNPSCSSLALADAQVWATLHLARVTRQNQERTQRPAAW